VIGTASVRRAAAAGTLVLLNFLLFALVARTFLPRLRSMIDVSNVENAEGLRQAQHPRGGDPAFRMPIGTLTEAAAFDRLSPAALGAWGLSLYAVAVLLVFALARELGGDWAGLAAAGAWQIFFLGIPPYSGFYKQFWVTGLGLLAALAFVRHARKPGPASAAGVGAAFGLTVLARSVYFPFIPFLAAAEAVRAGAARRRLIRALLIAGVFAAFLIPWTAMNAFVKGRFQPVEYGSGNLNIVIGALGAVHGGEGDYLTFMDAPESERGRSPILWAVRTVLASPGRYLRGAARRAAYALRLHPWLFALALLGFLRARRDAGARALAFQCAYFAAIVCTMPVEDNYFDPLWPLLLALAAAPLGSLEAPPLFALGGRAAKAGVAAAVVLGGLIAARAEFAVLSYTVRYGRRAPWSDAALDESLAGDPGNPWNSLDDARRRLRRNDAAGAVKILEATAPAIGDLPRHRLLLAWARSETGDRTPLLALSFPAPPSPERPAFNDDQHAALLIDQALALAASGRRAEALERMRAASDGNRRRLGFIHPEKEGPGAVLDPKIVARTDEDFTGFLKVSLEGQGSSPAEIDAALELAAEAHPTFSGWLELGRALGARGRKKDAAAALSRADALARSADDPELLHRLHFAWAEIGEPRRARGVLEVLARRFPERAVYWSDLGVALYAEGNVQEAEKAFRRALDVEPGMAAATLSLATVLKGRGLEEDGRRLCARALELWPGDPGSEAMRGPLKSCRDEKQE
jgi:tetratricopeptide (TPR) repeat protein